MLNWRWVTSVHTTTSVDTTTGSTGNPNDDAEPAKRTHGKSGATTIGAGQSLDMVQMHQSQRSSSRFSRIHQHSRQLRALRGFTLLELIVAIVVLAVLALIAIPTFRAITDNTETARVETELGAFGRAAATLRAFEPVAWDAALVQTIPELSSDPPWTLLDEGEPSTAYGELAWTDHGDGSVTLEMLAASG